MFISISVSPLPKLKFYGTVLNNFVIECITRKSLTKHLDVHFVFKYA